MGGGGLRQKACKNFGVMYVYVGSKSLFQMCGLSKEVYIICQGEEKKIKKRSWFPSVVEVYDSKLFFPPPLFASFSCIHTRNARLKRGIINNNFPKSSKHRVISYSRTKKGLLTCPQQLN